MHSPGSSLAESRWSITTCSRRWGHSHRGNDCASACSSGFGPWLASASSSPICPAISRAANTAERLGIFGLVIIAGWLLFGANLYGRTGFGLRDRPVFLLMWMASIPLFLASYSESFFYLLNIIGKEPIRDLQIQWRANGVLVGAFNQLAYGCIMYVGCRMNRDYSYAFCRLAFSLFAIGLLNTFTNYGHHTYHVPQSSWIHTIAFVVSMLEVIILVKVCKDFLGLLESRSKGQPDFNISDRFARSTTLWVFLMLCLSMFLAFPPVNALVHGTHVVVAHSMGSMLGIDTMILLAAMAFVLRGLAGHKHPIVCGAKVSWAIPISNTAIAVFWLSWILSGVKTGLEEYTGEAPAWLAGLIPYFPVLMVTSGLAISICILWVVWQWVHCLRYALKNGPPELPSRGAAAVDGLAVHAKSGQVGASAD